MAEIGRKGGENSGQREEGQQGQESES
jgi:hypothetical protein